jgi:hypothetical protein
MRRTGGRGKGVSNALSNSVCEWLDLHPSPQLSINFIFKDGCSRRNFKFEMANSSYLLKACVGGVLNYCAPFSDVTSAMRKGMGQRDMGHTGE